MIGELSVSFLFVNQDYKGGGDLTNGHGRERRTKLTLLGYSLHLPPHLRSNRSNTKFSCEGPPPLFPPSSGSVPLSPYNHPTGLVPHMVYPYVPSTLS